MINTIRSENYIGFLKVFLAFIFVLVGQSSLAVGLYTYNADGSEVTDTATGLVWRRCSEGQTWSGSACTGSAMAFKHQAALERAATQTAWRLPNVKELSSLADKANSSPAINTAAFPGTVSSYYWSVTPYAGSSSGAWSVDFSNGGVYGNSRSDWSFYVRLVR